MSDKETPTQTTDDMLRSMGIQAAMQQCMGIAQAAANLNDMMLDACIEAIRSDQSKAKLAGAPQQIQNQMEDSLAALLALKQFCKVLDKAGERSAARQQIIQPGMSGSVL